MNKIESENEKYFRAYKSEQKIFFKIVAYQ